MNRTEDNSNKKIYEKDWFVAIAVLLFFPLGLFLMFKYTKWSIRTKLSVVLAIPVIIFVLVVDISPPIDKIEISPTSVNMELDCIKILDVKCEPANANKNNLIYVSSDLSVARAEKGRIYSVGTGKAKLYAYDKKSGVQSEILDVTVCTSIIDAEARKELAEEIAADAKKLEENVPIDEVINAETRWMTNDEVKIYQAGENVTVSSTKPVTDTKSEESNTETNVAESDVQQEGSGGVVYVGKTGTKYHKQTCSTLKGGGTPVLRRDAELDGRTACKNCNP